MTSVPSGGAAPEEAPYAKLQKPGTLVRHSPWAPGVTPVTENFTLVSPASGRGCTMPLPALPGQICADTAALAAGDALRAAASCAAVVVSAPLPLVASDTMTSTLNDPVAVTVTDSGALGKPGFANCRRESKGGRPNAGITCWRTT